MIFLSVFKFVIYSTIVGSILTLFIILIKIILKEKLNARIGDCLWLILTIKLIIPFGPQSSLSIFNIIELNKFSMSRTIETNYCYNIANTKYNMVVNDKKEMDNTKEVKMDSINLNSSVRKNLINKNNTSIQLKHKEDIDYKSSNFKIVYFIWILGATVLLIYIIIKTIIFVFRINNEKICTNLEIIEILEECKIQIGINRYITIINTSMLKSPAIFGFLKPKLLLPIEIENNINKNELRFIFLHEIAHLKRRDNAISCIICFIQILHWFNPILWYAFHKMTQDREIACDALALSCINSKEYVKYGYTIIKLLKMYKTNNYIYGIKCILNNKQGIKRRIIMISLFKKNSYKWSIVTSIVVLVLGIVILTSPKNRAIVLSKNNLQNNNLNYTNKDIKLHDINSKRFAGKILIIPKDKNIVVGFNKNNIEELKTTSEIAKENNAICAINAGGFKASFNKIGFTLRGFIIHDGKVIYNELEDKDIKEDLVGFDKQSKLIVGKYTLNEVKKLNIKEAVSFGPTLISNGHPIKIKDDGGLGIAPRTAIGQRKDGTILFLVIEGRKLELGKVGATIKDIQNILIQYGAVNASNLDGGSSSTMYNNGKTIINNAYKLISSEKKNSQERNVPTTFMILPK